MLKLYADPLFRYLRNYQVRFSEFLHTSEFQTSLPKLHQWCAKVALWHLERHMLKGAPKLHVGIPKKGLSNDEKADCKGNCIRFIGASIRVCEKKNSLKPVFLLS